MISALASRYAGALVEVVFSPGSELEAPTAVTQLRTVAEMLAESGDLRAALVTPAVQPSRKRAVIARLAEVLQLSRVVRNFLYVIIDHGRIALLPQIADAFETLADEQSGVIAADAVSASALTEQQRAALSEQLSRLSGKQVKLRAAVDADLIGGVLARIGSTVYDGSILGQLRQMRRKLASEAA
jgi:F-type H+-transporting ATPase subunit delta